MTVATNNLLTQLKDPLQEMDLVRKGVNTNVVESFLNQEDLAIKDVLQRLDIPASTYFARRKSRKVLDANSTEKFIRLITVIETASNVIGKAEAKNWLYRKIPALGNEIPINLLDTEAGHRLVVQTLLQIKYGVYG